MSIINTIKNAWLRRHPEDRVIRSNGKHIQVCGYAHGIAFCPNGEHYEINELEEKA